MMLVSSPFVCVIKVLLEKSYLVNIGSIINASSAMTVYPPAAPQPGFGVPRANAPPPGRFVPNNVLRPQQGNAASRGK